MASNLSSAYTEPERTPHTHTHVFISSSCRASLKLILLRITRRPVLSPPIPEREIDPATLAEMETSKPKRAVPSGTTLDDAPPAHLKNNKVHNQLPSPESSPRLSATPLPPQQMVEEFLLPKALTPLDVKPPQNLLRPLTGAKEWLSEMIFLLRPLIYGEPRLVW